MVLDIHGVQVAIAAPGDVIERVRRELGEVATPAAPEVPGTLHYRYERGADRQHGFLRTDGTTARHNDLDEAITIFVDHLHHAVANRATTGVFVHAGAFAIDGHLVVVPGRSHAGKSSLVLAAVQRGATYFSDEFAVVDDLGRVHPYARSLSIRSADGARRLHPRLDLDGVVADTAQQPAAVLVTAYEPGARWVPRRLTGAGAALPIIDNTLHARRSAPATLAAAARIANAAVVLAGPRGEATELLDELERLLPSLSRPWSNPMPEGTS